MGWGWGVNEETDVDSRISILMTDRSSDALEIFDFKTMLKLLLSSLSRSREREMVLYN